MTAGAVATAPATRVERRSLPGALLVSASTAAAGVLTYAFLIVAARALGPAAYGRIGVLWAAMFIVAIVLFRPLEQTASQAIAARAARGESGGAVVRSVATAASALLGVTVCVAALAWPQVQSRLFHGSALLTAMLVVGIVLYGASYVVRGVVGGLRWFEGYSLGLVADSLVRLLIALPLLVTASRSLAAVAVTLAGAAGALAPLIAGRRRIGSSLLVGSPSPYHLRAAAAFALPAGLMAACDQVVVNGPPLLVALDGARPATVGVVFAATMLLRAPVYVFQGLAASLLPNFTHLRGTSQLRRQLGRLVAVLTAVGVLTVGGVAIAGPGIMRLLYGDRYTASRAALVLLGVAVAGYLVVATLSQALLAAGRAGAAAAGWAVIATLFVAGFEVAPGGELIRVAAALALSILAGLLVVGALVVGSLRVGPSPHPLDN